MYFKLSKAFLEQINKEDLLDRFPRLGLDKRKKKEEVVSQVLASFADVKQLGPCDAWILICPYCRADGTLATPQKYKVTPRFCVHCGRTSAFAAFEGNLKKTNQLSVLASKMNRKEERETKDVLLEQALVIVITGLEVLMREVYSLIYDHKHVILGQSIFDDVYSRSRNEFLNLGSAARRLRQVTSLGIKDTLSKDRYTFLSRMYSARHIIIHNCSIKDRDFLSQTGDPNSELRKPLRLKIPDIHKLISVAREFARTVNQEMRRAMLEFQHERFRLIRELRGGTKKQTMSSNFGTSETNAKI